MAAIPSIANEHNFELFLGGPTCIGVGGMSLCPTDPEGPRVDITVHHVEEANFSNVRVSRDNGLDVCLMDAVDKRRSISVFFTNMFERTRSEPTTVINFVFLAQGDIVFARVYGGELVMTGRVQVNEAHAGIRNPCGDHRVYPFIHKNRIYIGPLFGGLDALQVWYRIEGVLPVEISDEFRAHDGRECIMKAVNLMNHACVSPDRWFAHINSLPPPSADDHAPHPRGAEPIQCTYHQCNYRLPRVSLSAVTPPGAADVRK